MTAGNVPHAPALDPTDYSPEGVEPSVPVESPGRRVKDWACAIRDPLMTRLLRGRHPELANLGFDRILRNGSGISVRRLRAMEARRLGGLAGRRILVLGCGFGNDLLDWLPYRPALVLGVDLVNYGRCWRRIEERGRRAGAEVRCLQADLTAASWDFVEAGTLDVVSSRAVLEHVTALPALLSGAVRALRPGGLFEAAYGPLWFGPNGDHMFSPDPDDDYNHLVLGEADYAAYVAKAKAGWMRRETACDGPFLVERGLFSRLKADAYLRAFEAAGLRPMLRLVSLALSRAARYRDRFPDRWAGLIARHRIREIDLIAEGCVYLGERPCEETTSP